MVDVCEFCNAPRRGHASADHPFRAKGEPIIEIRKRSTRDGSLPGSHLVKKGVHQTFQWVVVVNGRRADSFTNYRSAQRKVKWLKNQIRAYRAKGVQ